MILARGWSVQNRVLEIESALSLLTGAKPPDRNRLLGLLEELVSLGSQGATSCEDATPSPEAEPSGAGSRETSGVAEGRTLDLMLAALRRSVAAMAVGHVQAGPAAVGLGRALAGVMLHCPRHQDVAGGWPRVVSGRPGAR